MTFIVELYLMFLVLHFEDQKIMYVFIEEHSFTLNSQKLPCINL